MRKKLSTLAFVAASTALAIYLYTGYGTLEPCGMLRAEVKIRLMDGRIETLGDIPKLIVNNDDQLWCAKEFVIAHLS
ncbi:hypothetical protein [Magnetovibrio sp.]|uniref:hypothetical protein n=1 Tax=Magnetovibrio sp. TaxID=2024836 RepID=UPI002F94CA5F